MSFNTILWNKGQWTIDVWTITFSCCKTIFGLYGFYRSSISERNHFFKKRNSRSHLVGLFFGFFSIHYFKIYFYKCILNYYHYYYCFSVFRLKQNKLILLITSGAGDNSMNKSHSPIRQFISWIHRKQYLMVQHIDIQGAWTTSSSSSPSRMKADERQCFQSPPTFIKSTAINWRGNNGFTLMRGSRLNWYSPGSCSDRVVRFNLFYIL